MTPKWPKKFDKKFGYIQIGLTNNKDIKSFIETEIIEKIIQDLETNPMKGSNGYTTLQYWIEKKQAQLRNNWLGKE